MSKLTDSQLIVLSSAAAREDGCAVAPVKMNKAAAMKVGASLVARKLMREVKAKPGAPVWRMDGDRPVSLVITAAGRKAIGVEDSAPIAAKGAMSPNTSKDRSKAPTTSAAEAARDRLAASTPNASRLSPRAGSKQALLIEMLCAKTGATLDALVEATGWLPHSCGGHSLSCGPFRLRRPPLQHPDGSAHLKLAQPKRQRCAIYTRKSTEHNLDLAFNSLDAQREACEAYVKSQAHEGWTLVRDRFDDGGLSGASLDRPALQSLLDRVRARQIDVIVVYKVDRLTRSLADFAKLVELFDANDVSFVSVTQSFNTTSSMGRLTLNVLLSFAQFEREVIGERVRDKIAASKRKGLWVGGPVPLGYRSVDKKLMIVPEEAELVRKIFGDYLRVGSVGALAGLLNAEGHKPKPRQLANGTILQAACYRVGPLAHLLKNRFYVGDVVYRGDIHKGEHQPILDRDVFEAVQKKLKEQSVERSAIRGSSQALLSGKLFDDRGHAMTPTYANKKGMRYRYYVSQALLQGRKSEAGSVARVSAPDVEGLVIEALRKRVGRIEGGDSLLDRDLVERLLARVVVRRAEIAIEMTSETDADGAVDSQGAVKVTPITIPFTPAPSPRKGVVHSPTATKSMDEASRIALLTAVARARRWIDEIMTDASVDFEMIAAREGLGATYIRRLAALAYLSPRIVEAIAEGHAPADLTATKLLNDLPLRWTEQEQRFLRA